MAILLDVRNIASVTHKQSMALKLKTPLVFKKKRKKEKKRKKRKKKKTLGRSWAAALKITPAGHNYSVKAELWRALCGCTLLKKGKEVK